LFFLSIISVVVPKKKRKEKIKSAGTSDTMNLFIYPFQVSKRRKKGRERMMLANLSGVISGTPSPS
jgi:uncharacterized membrane protein